jgi:hypothetical protein
LRFCTIATGWNSSRAPSSPLILNPHAFEAVVDQDVIGHTLIFSRAFWRRIFRSEGIAGVIGIIGEEKHDEDVRALCMRTTAQKE